ncbi:ERCC5 [Cordylochernes scorpioides]|uniref:ERCC5 n=1 Tax=Cordylochernes scorpioides TaxID=51811 RepID=A0ABY6K0E9_9ARAC|nr:ERCC5 [Cordylochernes scorpioides]
MIQPILKKLQDPKDQARIDSFFSVTLQKQEKLFPSKRLQKAVGKMAPTTAPPTKQSRPQKTRGKSVPTRIARRKPIQPPVVVPFDDESSGSSSSSEN